MPAWCATFKSHAVDLRSLWSFVSVIAPFILWGSYAYPLAFVIDYVFGDVLRGSTRSCQEVASESPNITFEDCEESRQTPYIMNRRFALFAAPLVFAFTCFVLKGYVCKSLMLCPWSLIFSMVFVFLSSFPTRLDENSSCSTDSLYLDFIPSCAQKCYPDDCYLSVLVHNSQQNISHECLWSHLH